MSSAALDLMGTIFDVPQVKWSDSHGAVDGHQAAGALYFCLPYMLKAKTCVVLGSGAGFVPMMILAAQRRLIEENVISKLDVTLVDAHTGIWGLPVYQTGGDIDPDLKLVKQLSADAASSFANIDYIHVDADHSYEGVTSDLECYFPKLSKGEWAITVHDTDNPRAAQGGLPLGAWDAARDFAHRHGLAIVNFHIGCGTALIMPSKDEPPSAFGRMFGRWKERIMARTRASAIGTR